MPTTKKTQKPEAKPPKTVSQTKISLTDYELIHLRDLFSVLLPPATDVTLSQALASLEDRPLVESKLWAKIKRACESAEIAVEDEAPDYVLAPSGVTPIGVFQLADSPVVEETQEVGDGDTEERPDGSLFKTKDA